MFTYDDWQSGQSRGPYPQPPNHIVSIREQRYKLARYYDADGKVPDQWEMYDLKTDPLERKNLAYKHYKRSPAQEREYRRLRAKLAERRADAPATAELNRPFRSRSGPTVIGSANRLWAPR